MRRIALFGILLALFLPAAATAAVAPAPVYGSGSGPLSPGGFFAGVTKVPGSAKDDAVVDVPLPFDFSYMGHTYPAGWTLHISTNGNISFTTVVDASAITDYHSSCPLPDAVHGPALFPLWQDLDASGDPASEGIYTLVQGTAPQRILVIEWRTQLHNPAGPPPQLGAPGDVNFEAVLQESTGEIGFLYKAVNGAGDKAAVGIQQGSAAGDATKATECQIGGIAPNTGAFFLPVAPGISGIAEQGQTLKGTGSAYTGDPNPTVSEQWQRCNGPGASCVDIPGATSSTYVLGGSDVGDRIRLETIATNTAGTASASSAPSAVVAPPPTPAPAYTVTHATGASIVPGLVDIGNHADDGSTHVALPFAVWFFGHRYTSASATSNGSLDFGSVNSSTTSACLPNATRGDAIDAYQMDLRTDTPGAGIYSRVTGSAPHRVFVLEWRTSYYKAVNSHANFEILLREDSPVVSVAYGNSTDAGAGAVAGVQHDIATTFNQFSCAAPNLTAGTVVSYSPSQPRLNGTPSLGATLGFDLATFTGRIPRTGADQWELCDKRGASCADIPGAIWATYSVPAADVGRTVRVRQTQTNVDGTGSSESQPSAVIAAPLATVRKLRIVPASFGAAQHGGSTASATGAKVSFRLNVAAGVSFSVQKVTNGRKVHGKCVPRSGSNRHRPPCTKANPLGGSFTVAGSAGGNSFHFTGRIGGHRLSPGRYVLLAKPTDFLHRAGVAATASFKIIR